MCCLFGVINYGNSFTGKQKARIVHALATASEVRGIDATGIAYNSGGKLHIYKRPVPGHKLSVRIPDEASDIMGHARMTTQGDGSRNYNNHPFQARAGKTAFALAHNGVLHNDRSLRRSLGLPRTNIETDSFVAAQLLQKKRTLNFDSLKYMAETVEGSFAFTVLDERDNLYFVRGDNPLSLIHYPERGLYLYASTAQILRSALCHIPYQLGVFEWVGLDSGGLLKIGSDGNQQRAYFHFDYPFAWPWFHYPVCRRIQGDYIRNLKSVAGAYGISPDQIDQLLGDGFTPEEIEEYLYCGEI